MTTPAKAIRFVVNIALLALFLSVRSNAQVSIDIGSGMTVSFQDGCSSVGSMMINTGGTFNITSGTLCLTGSGTPLTNDGTCVSTNSTLEYKGSSAQTIDSDLGFQNLTIDNPGGVILSTAVTVNGTLTLANGIITTSSHTLTIGSSGSVSGGSASSHVSGKLARTYSVTGSKAFPIGKGGNFRPLILNYTALDAPSTVTAEQFETALTGTLPPNTTLFPDRYWTVTQVGASAFTYDITLDGTGFTPTRSPVILKKDGTIVAYPATTPNHTVTGLASLSDFALGEQPSIVVQTKVLLEGPFSGGSMSTALNSILPTDDPYSLGESVGTIPADAIDWMLVELRSDETTTVASRAAFLMSDGSIVDLDGSSNVAFSSVSPGNYYIIIRHRNHLAVMSASAVELNSSSALYDFTTGTDKYYLSDAKQLAPGIYGMYAADVDGNGVISLAAELTVIRANNLQANYNNADVDLNGVVSLAAELTLVRANNLRASKVP